MNGRVDHVVVVGRDAAAWLTALGLQSAFGRTGVKVRVLELASHLNASDAYAAIPTLSGLHRLLGVDDRSVLDGCSGVYALAQRFSNWSGAAPPFLHAYDTQPVGLNNVDLVQYWLKARREGLTVAIEDFSLGAAMAKQGRIDLDGPGADGFARPAWGFHLDAGAYVARLRQLALRRGVSHTRCRLAAVQRRGDGIGSVTLDGGETIEADLWIDATGPEAALIGVLDGAAFESWRRWLPCDRVLAASAAALDPLPAFSQISAFRSGWIGLFPLRDRTAITAVYRSHEISDDAMLADLTVLCGLRLHGDAAAAPLEPGFRTPWVGNCVAIGDAAVALEPLDAVGLHLIHMGLSHLIALFPVDAEAGAERKAYNRALAAHARNIRDLQIAHYHLNRRLDEPLWDEARETPPPDELAYKIDAFTARGRPPIYDDEAFQAANWTQVLIGHGLIPRDYDPLVDMTPAAEQIQQLQRMLGFIASEVRPLPTLQQALAPAPPPTSGFF